MKILTQSYDIAISLVGNRTDKFAHFTFLFDRNKLISVGQNNMSKPSSKALYFSKLFNVNKFREFNFIHAEIDCLGKLWGKGYITGREKMVVLRMNKKGELLNSKPCGNCQIILDSIGLNRVWYSTENGFIQGDYS